MIEHTTDNNQRRMWAMVKLGPLELHNGRSHWFFRGPFELRIRLRRSRYVHIVALYKCHWAFRKAFRWHYGVEDKWLIVGPIGFDWSFIPWGN